MSRADPTDAGTVTGILATSVLQLPSVPTIVAANNEQLPRSKLGARKYRVLGLKGLWFEGSLHQFGRGLGLSSRHLARAMSQSRQVEYQLVAKGAMWKNCRNAEGIR